ncbi:alpha/beta fold hydrolase [Staphylococcus caeli]|uniref:Lipase n=1 Tax=Staphylococcus caeli TaxID=2201815 RepID=A0A1D4HZM9_9STAP|nr:alpha/beta hydrolase [Staphylococcus caeli]SCS23806.1 lipase [Staphylococcus caeli]SCS42538.1 lipase [Staphylococcus caeli]
MEKIATNFNTEITYIREGQGIPVILIHGLDGNMASMFSLKDALKHSFDVIIYDVRGHGKSTKTNAFQLDDHVDDLYTLMSKLEIPAAHIIGHDMGGVIAKHFSDEYESMVLSLTLIACDLVESVHGLNRLMVEHQDEIEGFDKHEALILLMPYMYKDSENAKKWLQHQFIYSRQSSEDSAIAARALMGFPVFEKNIEIKHTSIPTLIINGEHDPLVTQETVEEYRNAFTSVHVQSFSQSGHAPHIEEPQHFLEVLTSYIKSITTMQNIKLTE